jgi:23S rRNA (uracil1939-C5)-methyltransferase
MNGQLYELTLTALSYGGDALGRIPDGDRVVFVPFGLPGERVRVRLVGQRRGYARGELVEVLEPASERILPRCKHFGLCGGCHYQHMPYDLQLKAKAEILRDQFRRIGHIENAPVQPAVACPDPYNYRNQVQFHLTPHGRLGYVRAGPFDQHGTARQGQRSALTIIPISECHLPEAAINSLWPQLEFDPGMNIERVSIRQGKDDEIMLALESDSAELPELEIEAGISVAHIYEEHAAVMAGRDHVIMEVLGRDFQVSAASFFQVNAFMAAQMVEHILTGITSLRGTGRRSNLQFNLQHTLESGPTGLPISQSTDSPTSQSIILDVYCGVGLFSAFLAPKCKRLISIESSESACEDFALNLEEFENVELYEDAAENVLPALDVQPDIILVDPPRAGLQPAALDAIVRMEPATIIYVSCDPSTLARDAARLLNGGYHLRSVTPFDLFPQTYHIESISWFDLERPAGPAHLDMQAQQKTRGPIMP